MWNVHVLVDNQGAVEDAVKRLLESGHKKIGMIAWSEHIFTTRERYLGYETALKNAGIPAEESLLVHGDYTIAGEARIMKALAGQTVYEGNGCLQLRDDSRSYDRVQ